MYQMASDLQLQQESAGNASSKPYHHLKCLILLSAYSLDVHCRVIFWLAWQWA